MPYHLHDVHLRVVHKYLRQKRNAAISTARFLILEHILPTTAEFVRHLSASGGEIAALVAKPYSIDARIKNELESEGYQLFVKSYDELETTDFLDSLLASAITQSKNDGRRIVVIDVGGYFAQPISRIRLEDAQYFAGVVEDTTFGHNRYAKLVSEIPVPVVSVARSVLKEIEARFVGRDVVFAMDRILRSQGITLAGRRALVIGYGMIGSNIAYALRRQDIVVDVFDVLSYRMLQAYTDGYHIQTLRKLLESADIIYSATASQALRLEDIEECKSDVILVSAGSKDTEFDVAGLREQAVRREAIGDHLERFSLSNNKRIVVATAGTAVNFALPSLPEEILDLVFAEILVATLQLLKQEEGESYPPGYLHESDDSTLNKVSNDWLRSINPT
jgi:adenosylhomocysteinase